MIYHNDSIPTEILSTYIEVVSSIEYLCTVAARENDPNCQWQYVRFETDDYEMMVTVGKLYFHGKASFINMDIINENHVLIILASTHWVFLLAEPQENYNGEKEEENISKLGAAV